MAELKKFDELLSDLHNDSYLQDDYSSDENVIQITGQRQFTPGSKFNTIIAYEGDINSQLITFKCPRLHDKHDLSACENKELKWRNLTSGIEGTARLKTIPPENQEYFYVQWEVPSDACVQAGVLDISISFYDKIDGYIVFSWNTANYNGLSVGKSIETVGFTFPAKDEILTIDNETRQIIAPAGYNNIVCNCGDVGVASVYFLINRYLGRKKDLDVNSANISIYVKTQETTALFTENIEKRLYTEEIFDRNKEGIVLIEWKIPEEISVNQSLTEGFEIALGFTQDGKTWHSNSYTLLKIGNSVYGENIGELIGDRSVIYQLIDQYFNDYNVIFDANNK